MHACVSESETTGELAAGGVGSQPCGRAAVGSGAVGSGAD